jgi:hypothetical protein
VPGDRACVGKPGQLRRVSSVREAAEVLLDNWPEPKGLAHKLAVEPCMTLFPESFPSIERTGRSSALAGRRIYVREAPLNASR